MSKKGQLYRELRRLKRDSELSDEEWFLTLHSYVESLNPKLEWIRCTNSKTASALEGITEEDQISFIEFHKSLVNQIIGFINSHPNLKNKIDEYGKKFVEAEDYPWLRDYNLIANLHLDGINDSLEASEWQPTLDSSFYLDIGGDKTVILSA